MDDASSPDDAPRLRLVWTNPTPPAPRRRVDLARAIERHLEGGDGLSREDFVLLFARGSFAHAVTAEETGVSVQG